MNIHKASSTTVLAAAIAALVGMSAGVANAEEPCGDFGECKVLVEINSSDGDVGFHFLMDGTDLRYGALFNPKHRKIYSYGARREMARQFITETFNESAEPLCWYPDEDDEEYGENVVTLEQFIDRWTDGKYHFFGIGEGWETSYGKAKLTFNLPAAPMELNWEEDDDEEDEVEGEISWLPGVDLGECADEDDIDDLLADGVLPMHPADVEVVRWEVVLEPDVEDGDIIGSMKYVVSIPGDADLEVEVPDDYLATLPPNTPAKIEIGAIGIDDNATFSEEGDICLNEDDPDESDDEDGCGFGPDEDDDE